MKRFVIFTVWAYLVTPSPVEVFSDVLSRPSPDFEGLSEDLEACALCFGEELRLRGDLSRLLGDGERRLLGDDRLGGERLLPPKPLREPPLDLYLGDLERDRDLELEADRLLHDELGFFASRDLDLDLERDLDRDLELRNENQIQNCVTLKVCHNVFRPSVNFTV